jgi:hypothetical protein
VPADAGAAGAAGALEPAAVGAASLQVGSWPCFVGA